MKKLIGLILMLVVFIGVDAQEWKKYKHNIDAWYNLKIRGLSENNVDSVLTIGGDGLVGYKLLSGSGGSPVDCVRDTTIYLQVSMLPPNSIYARIIGCFSIDSFAPFTSRIVGNVDTLINNFSHVFSGGFEPIDTFGVPKYVNQFFVLNLDSASAWSGGTSSLTTYMAISPITANDTSEARKGIYDVGAGLINMSTGSIRFLMVDSNAVIEGTGIVRLQGNDGIYLGGLEVADSSNASAAKIAIDQDGLLYIDTTRIVGGVGGGIYGGSGDVLIDTDVEGNGNNIAFRNFNTLYFERGVGGNGSVTINSDGLTIASTKTYNFNNDKFNLQSVIDWNIRGSENRLRFFETPYYQVYTDSYNGGANDTVSFGGRGNTILALNPSDFGTDLDTLFIELEDTNYVGSIRYVTCNFDASTWNKPEWLVFYTEAPNDYINNKNPAYWLVEPKYYGTFQIVCVIGQPASLQTTYVID